MSDGGQSGGWVVVFVHGEGALGAQLRLMPDVVWTDGKSLKKERVSSRSHSGIAGLQTNACQHALPGTCGSAIV